MRRVIFLFICIGLIFLRVTRIHAQDSGFSANLITDPSAVFTIPQVPKPSYNQPITDPTFHTRVTRIAGDAGTSFTLSNGTSGTWGSDVRQHYNDDQAWNADGSLLLLQNSSSPSQVILDGESYQPRYGKCSNYSNYDDRWHPSINHKYERINVKGSKLSWFDVVNCIETRSWTLPFSAQNDLSQNPDSVGRFIALYDSSRIFVVDMDPQAPLSSYASGNRRIGPVYDFSSCGLSDCSVDFAEISPSGKYIILAYNGDHNRLFDVNPDTLAITPHAYSSSSANCPVTGHDPVNGYMFDLGHPGVAYNPFDNNEEVIIGQRRSWCPSSVNGINLGSVVMVRLKDNQVTSLTDPGNEASSYHISTVNNQRPGWVYVSYYPGSGKRFSDEIIAIKLDGSKQVQRFVHTHTNTSGCYRCEAHPVPSRDGRRILFASAWNANCSSCGSSSNPQGYVVDARANPSSLSSPTPTRTPTPTSSIFPSPTSSSSLTATPAGSCPLNSQGDANCDNLIDLIDFESWRREFTGTNTTVDSDFNRDGRINLIDFEVWRRSFTSR